jgi:hypothetical protein
MKTVSTPRLLLLALTLALGLSAGPAAGQDAASQIRAEIDRLERVVSAKPAADPDWKEARPELAGTLGQARASLQAGRLYLSLEELEQARTSLRALEVAKESGAAKGGLPGFESAWKKASAELALNAKAPAGAWDKVPAIFQAMAETAAGQKMILLAASRSYADVTSAGSGFYYLGQARAAAESARFCASLRSARPAAPAAPLPLRPVTPELRKLQERTVAAFKPPHSIEHHSDFIRLNATLKLAGELDGARYDAGALYQYLDAVQQFSRLELAPPDAAQRSALGGNLAALRARLRNSPQDDSIAELFLERAEALLGSGKGAAPGPDAWKNAAVIAGEVLPAYFAWQKPAPAPNQLASQPITVTLVRWPYT